MGFVSTVALAWSLTRDPKYGPSLCTMYIRVVWALIMYNVYKGCIKRVPNSRPNTWDLDYRPGVALNQQAAASLVVLIQASTCSMRFLGFRVWGKS